METYSVKLTYAGLSTYTGRRKTYTYDISANTIDLATQIAISNSNTGDDAEYWTLIAVNARKSLFG